MAEGTKALREGDYPTAFREFAPLAARGDLAAITNIGLMYARGLGVPRDEVRARDLYARAAEGDYVIAQYNLAMLYKKEGGQELAAQWLEQAAFNGHTRSQYLIGVRQVEGTGIEQDYVLGLAWLEIVLGTASDDLRPEIEAYLAKIRPDLPEISKTDIESTVGILRSLITTGGVSGRPFY